MFVQQPDITHMQDALYVVTDLQQFGIRNQPPNVRAVMRILGKGVDYD